MNEYARKRQKQRKEVEMLEGSTTLAKAMIDFFSERKLTIGEMKALTPADKAEIREALIAEGYQIQAP